MAGQFRDVADDGSYAVTVGSADDPRYPDDTYFISQQDDRGNHMTSIYDSQHNLLNTSYEGRGR